MRPQTSILLVSDQTETAGIWRYVLEQQDLSCRVVSHDMLERDTVFWDLAIIDLYSTDAKPLWACRSLHEQCSAPILLIWDAREESAVLSAYEAGAAEVLFHPVSPRLLIAKVGAWLRHASIFPMSAPEILRRNKLELNPETRTLTLPDKQAVRLSALELRLTYALMQQPQRVLSWEALLAHVWGHDGADMAQLKNLVYRLRRKIEPNPSQPQYIQTVAGQGYCFSG